MKKASRYLFPEMFNKAIVWSVQPKTPMIVKPPSVQEYRRQRVELLTVRETEGLDSWYRAHELWN